MASTVFVPRFVCPVVAERSPVELRVGSGAYEATVKVAPEHVTFVTGDVADLVALERTLTTLVVRGREGSSFDVTAPAPILVEPEFDAFIERVLAAPHRAVFDAIVVAHCAWGLDVSLPVGGRFWSAAKGAPLSDVEVKHLVALVKQEVDLVDPDRFASQSEFRSLDAIDAALVGDRPRMVRKAVSASYDEPAIKRWLSVLASALDGLGAPLAMDPIAVDVLACALRPCGAFDEPVVPTAVPKAAPKPALEPAPKPATSPSAPLVTPRRPSFRSSFVYPVFADAGSPIALRIEAPNAPPPVEVPLWQAAYVIASQADGVRMERTNAAVTIHLPKGTEHELIAPSAPLVEGELDAFVRRVGSTRHPVTFAVLLGNRHVRKTMRSRPDVEMAGKLWSAAERPEGRFPTALAQECAAMYSQHGSKVELATKAFLQKVVTCSPEELVVAALRASIGRSSVGGYVEERFAPRIEDPAVYRRESRECAWLSVVATTLSYLDEHSPRAVHALADAFGFSDYANPPKPVLPSREAPPPRRGAATTFGGVKMSVFEIAGGTGRFGIMLDGKRHRVRSRKQLFDVDTLEPASHDWIEGDDAELGMLVECLESKYTRRTEEGGRLVLEEHHAGLSGFDADTTVVVTLVGVKLVEVDMKYRVNELNPGFGW